MATGRIRGITIELQADTSKATKALSNFEKSANQVATRLKDIDKVLKLNPTSTVALSQKQEALAMQVEKTRTQLEMEQEALAQLQAGPQTEKTIEQQKRLNLQIEETKAKLREAQLAYDSFGSVAVQKLNAVGEKMKTLGDNMAKTGQTLTRKLTVPIMALGGLSVKELATFESSMASVGAVSQASGEEIDQMSAKARELAATTQFTAEETTQAYHYMALAGWEPVEMMDGLEGVLNLVAASGEDLGRVSDIVTDGLTMFGLSAEEATDFADVLAVTMSHTNTNVDQLGDALKYVGPVAGAMSYNIEDVALALGVMANNGIKGSTAGTTLRNILTNMAKPTAEVETAMDKLGVSLDDGRGNMYSLQEVLGQFRQGLGTIKVPLDEYQNSLARLDSELEDGTITEEEYAEQVEFLAERAYGAEGALMAQYAASIAGKRGMAGLLAIVSADEEAFYGLSDAIYDASGTSEKMRKTMENTLSGQFKILKSQVSELGMEFGEALLPTVRSVVEWLQNLVVKFQSLSPETKETIAKILAIVAAIGPLLIIGGKLIAGIGTLLTMPAKIVGAIAKVKAAFTMISSVVSVSALGWAAAIAGAIALIVVIWKNWDKIKEVLINVMNKIKEFITKIWTAIKDFFVKIITGIKDYFVQRFTLIRDTLTAIWNAIKARVVAVWNAIGTWISTKIGNIRERFSAVFTAIRDRLAAIWTNIKERIALVWNTIGTWISTKIGNIRERFSNVFTAIRDRLSNIWGNIKERIANVWNTIGTWISNKISNIRDRFVNVFTNLRERVASIFQGIKTKITSPIESARNTLSGIISRIKGLFPLSIGRIFSGLKLPHITWGWKEVAGGLAKIPTFSVEWYKKAMANGIRLDGATIFGMNAQGQPMGGGEAGTEWIVGQNSLLSMIQSAVGNSGTNTEAIAQAAKAGIENATINLYMDGKKVTGVVTNVMTASTNSAFRFNGV